MISKRLIRRGERFLDKQIDVVTLIKRQIRFETLLKSMTSPLQWKLAARSKQLVLNDDSSTQKSHSSGEEAEQIYKLLKARPATANTESLDRLIEAVLGVDIHHQHGLGVIASATNQRNMELPKSKHKDRKRGKQNLTFDTSKRNLVVETLLDDQSTEHKQVFPKRKSPLVPRRNSPTPSELETDFIPPPIPWHLITTKRD